MTNKTWNKPTIEVTAIRNAQNNNFAQADGSGQLKGSQHQS